MHPYFSRLLSSFVAVSAATVILTSGATAGAIVFGTVPAALAQDQPAGQAPGNAPRGGRFGKMLLSLDLTDAQKSQIRAIIADARKQNAGITDRDQKRANMKAAYAKVDTVLTPAQRTQLHAKLEAMRAERDSARPQ